MLQVKDTFTPSWQLPGASVLDGLAPSVYNALGFSNRFQVAKAGRGSVLNCYPNR